MSTILREIGTRRRRRMISLAVQLLVLVLLPTMLAGWYFLRIATPLYTSQTEFVIQGVDTAPVAAPDGLGGMLGMPASVNAQEAIIIQGFLQSREAMAGLDRTEGFRAHFSDPRIDPIQRLDAIATNEVAYRFFRRHVLVAFDPSEGVLRMDVTAADPETSLRFSEALLALAEAHLEQVTERMRATQMRDAEANMEHARMMLLEAQAAVLDMQERFQILSSDTEAGFVAEQVADLEAQLIQARLSLSALMANARPNAARMRHGEQRVSALEAQIASLRGRFTNPEAEADSIARMQRALMAVENDVQIRQELLNHAIQALETARLDTVRQMRFISAGVVPVLPDEASHPRSLRNTAFAFLILAGMWFMASMTIAVVREQAVS